MAEEFKYKTPTALTIDDAVSADDSAYSSEKIESIIPTISHDTVSLGVYDAEPARDSVSNVHGGIVSLATGQALNSITDLVVTKGIGKLLIIINAGTDVSGEITVSGTVFDRDTGADASGSEVIAIDGLTVDNSAADGNGNMVHKFTGAYITSGWYSGTVTLSTTDVDLTDIDIYSISFEQFDDTPVLTLDTFDINLVTTNVAAEFDAYLYALILTGANKCNILNPAGVHIGEGGEVAIADKYWRLRRGKIGLALAGATDGVWAEIHYSNSPAYIEDMSMKIWATEVSTLRIEGGSHVT